MKLEMEESFLSSKWGWMMSHQVSIVLCRPQNTGNIGSIARAMCNFSFSKLILVQPPENWRQSDALLTMSNGYFAPLDQALVVDSLQEIQFICSRLIGFTRRIGEKRPIHGELQDLKESIRQIQQPQHFGLVFGNERTGLLAEELDFCDTLYSIATSKELGSLNLAVASSIVMYEIALELQRTDVHADGSSLKATPIVSHVECIQRAQDIVETLGITDVFEKGKDQKDISLRYVQKVLQRASLTPFESNWIKRMVMRLRPFLSETSKTSNKPKNN